MIADLRTWIALLLLAGVATAAERELSRDEGALEIHRVEGRRVSVAFDAPDGDWRVRAVRLCASHEPVFYDTPFRVAILDAEGEEVASSSSGTTSLTFRGFPEWRTVVIPTPPPVSGTFQVVVEFERKEKHSIVLGYAAARAPGTTHSTITEEDGRERAFTEGEWMLRPVLVDDLAGTTEIGPAGRPVGEQRVRGSFACGVELEKPSGSWWIKAILVYGEESLTDSADRLRITILSGKSRVLYEEEVDPDVFPGSKAWVEFQIRAQVRAPSRFRVMLGRTGYKGDIEIGIAEPAGESVSWDRDDRKGATTWKRPGKGDYLIRAVLSRKTKPIAGVKKWLKDFDFVVNLVEKSHPIVSEAKPWGYDGRSVRKTWRPVIEACRDDREFLLAMTKVLACLEDGRARLTPKMPIHVPAFDGLDGAGLWIGWEKGKMILRGLSPGHPLADRLKPGALLVSIDGRPAQLVLREVCWRLREWYGWSTWWQLAAALSTRFFPFGNRDTLPATFMAADGSKVEVVLPRLGSPSRIALTTPKGIPTEGLAVSGTLDDTFGYVRILGGMDAETRTAFDTALENVKDAKALVLDVRGAGDGDDRHARAMAGRFYPDKQRGDHGFPADPTGEWQYPRYVALLFDETTTGALETFVRTLNLNPTVVTVGRVTSGSSLIPKSYRAPSRLFSFTMGRTARPRYDGSTAERRPLMASVYVTWWPGVFERSPDPILAVALDVLRMLRKPLPAMFVVGSYAGVLTPSYRDLVVARKVWPEVPKPEGLTFPDLFDGLLDKYVEWEIRTVECPFNPTPAYEGGIWQLSQAGAEVPPEWEKEAQAQRAWDGHFRGPNVAGWGDRKGYYLLRWGSTRYGRAVREDTQFR